VGRRHELDLNSHF